MIINIGLGERREGEREKQFAGEEKGQRGRKEKGSMMGVNDLKILIIAPCGEAWKEGL